MKIFNFSLIIFFIISYYSIAQTKIPPDSAANYINHKVIVVGNVEEVHQTQTGTYFLNMGGTFPDNTFTAVIFKSDIHKFNKIEDYEGKEVEISGKVTKYKGQPEIIIKSTKQIKLIKTKKK